MRRLRRILVAGGLMCGLALIGGCASLGGTRHRATVSVVTAHGVLSAIQDTEMLLVCGRQGAPDPPLCVPPETHRLISARLAVAFGLEGDLARIVRALPAGEKQPAQVLELVGSIATLVKDVLELIPKSPAKESLEQKLAGHGTGG